MLVFSSVNVGSTPASLQASSLFLPSMTFPSHSAIGSSRPLFLMSAASSPNSLSGIIGNSVAA